MTPPTRSSYNCSTSGLGGGSGVSNALKGFCDSGGDGSVMVVSVFIGHAVFARSRGRSTRTEIWNYCTLSECRNSSSLQSRAGHHATLIDVLRTQLWFHVLKLRSGLPSAYAISIGTHLVRISADGVNRPGNGIVMNVAHGFPNGAVMRAMRLNWPRGISRERRVGLTIPFGRF